MEKNKCIITTETTLSILAFIISCVTLYYQFIYKDLSITASVVDVTVSKYSSNCITTRIVYSNNGNVYTTILRNNYLFYQNGNTYSEKFNNRIIIGNSEQELLEEAFNEKFDYTILKPGEQIMTVIKKDLYLSKKTNIADSAYKKTPGFVNWNKEIYIALDIEFLDINGKKKQKLIELGSFNLDKNKRVSGYSLGSSPARVDL